MGYRKVNATRSNKRILAGRLRFQRMNSPKGPDHDTSFSRGLPFASADLKASAGLGGRLAVEPIHLALDQLAIKPFASHQEIGRAVLDYFAELQHDDAVEIPHR